MIDLGTNVAGLRFKNPIWVGSSELTMDQDGILACAEAGAGAVIAKSINENPGASKQLDIADYVFFDREYRTQSGPHRDSSLLNRSGLAQTPIDEWLLMLDRARARAAEVDCTVIGSITVSTAEGAARLAQRLAEVVPIIELNVGAPHGREAAGGAVVQLSQADQTRALIETVRAATDVPLIVKLPGGAGDVSSMAVHSQRGGADAVAMIGRFNGFLPDIETDEPLLGSWGAYGGPWGLPMSLYEVSKTFRHEEVTVPIVGTNGARSADDVLRFILSGASAVELVALIWAEGPAVIGELLTGLERALAQRDLASLQPLIGKAAAHARRYSEIVPTGTRPEPWRSSR